jgi:hypothetical protein
MPVGDLIQPTPSIPIPVAMANRLGPRKAMAKALAAYLETVWWYVDSGDDVDPRDSRFQLNPIATHWPRPDVPLNYPTASIIELGETTQRAHNFTPSPLEETWGQFDELAGYSGEPGRTVLWKEAEAVASFQVDFWNDGDADRQAIEARLSAVFSPGQERYGVLLEGPELYYSQPMRFALESHRDDDTATTAYAEERRLRCTVTGECDIVSLRMATATTVTRPCITVIDPNDPPEES